MENDVEGAAADAQPQHRLQVFDGLEHVEALEDQLDAEPDHHRVLNDFAGFVPESHHEGQRFLLVELLVRNEGLLYLFDRMASCRCAYSFR